LLACVDHGAADELAAEGVSELDEAFGVVRGRGGLGLDLDGDNATCAVLENEVDLRSAAVTEVIDPWFGVAPARELHDLHRDECLECDTGDTVVFGDALLVGAEQMREQPAVGDVDLWCVQDPREKARSPRGDSPDEEDRLEQADVALDRLLVEVEGISDVRVTQNPARKPAGSARAVSRTPSSSRLTTAR
jgi:hypothetical protein